jgi:hypothetical protein
MPAPRSARAPGQAPLWTIGFSGEDERPKYVPGQFVAGSKHYLIEEQQQKARGFLRNCGAWERQFGSGRNP